MKKEIIKDDNGNILAEVPEMIGNKDVFISYKRENAPFVVRLYNELERHNIKSWLDLDRLHHNVGDKYEEKIHNGINCSEYFLLIYTKSVEDSDFIIEKELAYAISKGKTILVYPKDTINLSNSRLTPYIHELQWLDTIETAALQPDTQESIKDELKKAQLASLTAQDYGFSIFDDQNIFLIRIALQRILGRVMPFGNYKKLCGVPSGVFYTNKSLQLKVIDKGLFLYPPEKYKMKLEDLRFYERGNQMQKNIIADHIKSRRLDNQDLLNKLNDFFKINSDIYSMKIIHEWLSKQFVGSIYNEILLPFDFEEMSVERFIEIVAEMTAINLIRDLESKIAMFNGTELGVYDIVDTRVPDVEYPYVEVKLYYSDYFTFKCMTEMYHILCSINNIPFNDINRGNIKQLSPFLCSIGLGGYISVNNNGSMNLLWTKRARGISSGDTWHFSYDETVSLLKDSPGGETKIIVADDGSVHLIANDILYRAIYEELGIERSLICEDHHGIFEIGIIQSERLEIELISSATLHLTDKNASIETQIKMMHDNSTDGYLEISKIKIFPLNGSSHLIGKIINPEALEIAERMKGRIRDNIGKRAIIGNNTTIECGSYIDDDAQIGEGCRIHRNVYVGKGVNIGNNVKIQNNNSIYPGVCLSDGVFVGTNVSFTNDMYPRAIRKSDGQPVDNSDWDLVKTVVKTGASIGAGAVIRCGVTIGEWSMIGCGAVVVDDVAPYTTVVGNPAHVIESKEILR